MDSQRAARLGGLFLMLLALVGCGEAAPGEVTGTVTYNGKPVEEGAITFTSADGKGGTGGGQIKDGKFEAKRVPVGRMKVSITGAKVVGHKKIYNTPNSPTMELKANYIPEKFNEKTELTFEVQSGPNQKDFELKGE